ncbi:MAG: UDP-4-amino-4,6-dideoxy-N-acetyl-beta-L-altrosamine transaminase [Candidatus Micrarchaeia archaeon]
MLQYSDIWIEEDDISAVTSVLKNGYASNLPKVEEFEKKFAGYIGTKYAVAFNSGTSALHASTFAIGIKKGDEAITTPMTFAATSNSILYQNGKPIFADIDKKTYNIDPEEIRKKITKKTKAIIPVHYTGQPCDMDSINKIAKENDLFVIEDASHAPGATYKGKKAGTMSDLAVFSFHPVKHIATYEGGMVATNNPELYEKIRLFRTHGITRDRSKMKYITEDAMWVSDQILLGYNYRLTDIQAALGFSQLKKLDRSLEIRRKYAKIYNEELEKLDFINIPYQLPSTNSAWHLYVIQINQKKLGISRKQAFERLREAGIGVWVHYLPVYYYSYYQSLGYNRGICPNAEKLYENILSIPMFAKMSENDVYNVIEKIKSLRD